MTITTSILDDMSLTEHAIQIMPGGKIGQAPALNRTQWLKWEEFISMKAGPRMGATLRFTGRFGLRTGEAVALTGILMLVKYEGIHADMMYFSEVF